MSKTLLDQLDDEDLIELREEIDQRIGPANPSRVSSGSTRCSHGGDNAVANAARSHDSALQQLVDKLRQSQYDYYAMYISQGNECGHGLCDDFYNGLSIGYKRAADAIDKLLETAHAVGIKGENTE